MAVEILRPFVGGEISDTDLRGMTNEAYATFRHPAVVPLDQTGPSQFVLELFHGPTLAFKDVAMQLVARLMDHVLAQRGERTTIVGGDLGRHRRRRGARIRRARHASISWCCFRRPHFRGAAADDDDVGREQRPRRRHRRHVRRLPGAGEGPVQSPRFRDEVSLSGVNSINWARIVSQAVYYFTSAVALGAPARQVDFTVPTGNFGDIFAGYVAKRMGLPMRTLRVATNVNDILARTLSSGAYEVRDVHETTSPSMDIQISSNFERLVFEATGRDAGDHSRADGVAQSVAPVRACRRRRCARSARILMPAVPTRARSRPRSAPPGARPAT